MVVVAKVVLNVVGTEIFGNRHPVADGEEMVVVIVNTVIENGFHDEVLLYVHIEKFRVELLEHLLHGQCHISGATSQVNAVMCFFFQISYDGTTYFLVSELIHVVFQHNLFDMRCRDAE